MKYDLLVRKLHSTDKKYITSDKIKEYCTVLEMSYKEGIVYLTRTKHLHTVLRGIFYKPGIEERKYKNLKVNHIEALSEALRIKGIKKWYLGLETALKLNNLTHEFFAIDYVITNSISRTRPMVIFGNKVMFVKIKPELFSFGIKDEKGIKFSDPAKTILDIIYLKRYKGLEETEVMNSVMPYLNKTSYPKLKRYAKHYNKKIRTMIDVI